MVTGALMGGMSGAGSGAAVGTALGGPGIGTAVGAGIGILSGFLSDSGNQANQDMMQAQLAQQQANQQQALGFAKPTVEELGLMQSELQNQKSMNDYFHQTLYRTQSMLQAINPNIMEAANQQYSLMTGGDSAALHPLQAQQDRQLQQLHNTLRQQMGSGYMSTTAGQAAIANFQTQANEAMTQARTGMMGQMGAIGSNAAGTAATVSGTLNAQGGLLSSMGNEYMGQQRAIAGQQISALTGSSTTPYTGANYMGSILNARSGQQYMNSALTGGTALAGVLNQKKAAGEENSFQLNTLGSGGGPQAQDPYSQGLGINMNGLYG